MGIQRQEGVLFSMNSLVIVKKMSNLLFPH